MLRAHLQLVWYKVDVHLILSLLCRQTLAMSHLHKLPTELLIQIFAASDTVFNAIHLSATNQFLATVWLKNSNSIIQSILEPSTPAYKEAVAQAFLETHLKSSTNGPLLLAYPSTEHRLMCQCVSSLLDSLQGISIATYIILLPSPSRAGLFPLSA
jgi:hypothetical protein